MDTGVPAAGPWLVLALAALGLLVVGVPAAWSRLRSTRTPPSRPHPVEDDLPAFLAAPPGTRPAHRAVRTAAAHVPLAGPGAPVPLAAPPLLRAPIDSPAASPAEAPSSGARLLAGPAAAALVLIALTAVVALLSRQAAPASPSSAPAATPAPPAPALPVPPSSPTAGESGAGELAFLSVPVSRGGESARLSFGGVVLERYAVGVRAAYPTVGLTRSGDRALAHVQLPTWNCFTPEAPADPVAAGCVASLTEYADLPTPALSVTPSRAAMTVAGRFATYTRPNGSAPVYTGDAYDLTVTVAGGRARQDGSAPASGTFTLGGRTARTVGGAELNGVRFGR